MRPSVIFWAKCDNIGRPVCAIVREGNYMVKFEGPSSIPANKSRQTTVFAVTMGAE